MTTMIKILSMFIICVVLATFSERNTEKLQRNGGRYRFLDDPAFLLLICCLTLFSGFRTYYNDTYVYMDNFRKAKGLEAFFANPENLQVFSNPLFYFFVNLLREITNEPQVMVFLTSLFVQICYVCFMKRYSDDFAFSIFLYFTLGTFNTTLAIIKQSMAVAVFTLGFHYLKERKWIQYYLMVFIAVLFHSFAVVFTVLPLFDRKPWRLFTFLFVGAVIWALTHFQETITEFMFHAENLGLDVHLGEITHEHTVNILRVAVYAIPPLISLIFARYITPRNTGADNILIHMSIISFAAMVMGTQSGANIFARMAHYFEIATLCCLPGMLKRTFDERSLRLVSALAGLGFFVFFLYGNRGFDAEYVSIALFDLF